MWISSVYDNVFMFCCGIYLKIGELALKPTIHLWFKTFISQNRIQILEMELPIFSIKKNYSQYAAIAKTSELDRIQTFT